MNELLTVEIFWDGDGYYFSHPNESDRLGGPFSNLHKAWKEVDSMNLEVVRVNTTRGQRSYRKS